VVLTNARPGAPDGFEYEAGVSIDGRRRGLREPGAVGQHVALARRLRRLAPAVVHCGRALPEGFAALLASTTSRSLPFVVWVHGEEVNSALQSREHTLLMRVVHRRARLLLANSRNTLDVLTASGVRADKVRVVYPGVDTERFANARPIRPTGDGPVLLTVGRLQRRKGHDLVLQALPALRRRHQALRYVIVGDGEERGRLEQMVRDLGITEMVTFAGEVPLSDLPGYFAGCDVFVMPNRVHHGDFEGFGIVFLEAAAAGRPVVGGRSGGVPEAIAEGESGLLVTGDDAGELASTLEGLLADAAFRQRLGCAGRERVHSRFTWQASADRLHAVHLEASGAPA
jgi:phosphatidyl-myo-inositol dimannoside synthase